MAATPGTPPVTPPAQPAATDPAGAPGAQRQQPAATRESGFWGRFPSVPVEQREALEPHLKQIQGEFTRLQQQVAPFKGYTPQQISGVAAFAQQFDANPVGMFLTLAQRLQARGLIHESLDVEALAAVIRGEDPDAGNPQQPDPNYGTGDYDDPRDAQIAEMRAELDELKQGRQEDIRTRQERVEDGMLRKTLDSMRKTLVEAGYPADQLTDQFLQGQIIAHGGKVEPIVQSLTGLRTTMLKGAIKTTKEPDEVDLPNGAPKPTRRTATKARKGDSFSQAGAAAEQFLKSANAKQQG